MTHFGCLVLAMLLIAASACSTADKQAASGKKSKPESADASVPAPLGGPSQDAKPGEEPLVDPSGGDEPADASGILYLSGTAAEIGRKQGETLGQEIITLVDSWLLPKINTLGFISNWLASSKAQNMEAHIPSDYVEEMRALAEGAGIDYANALIANNAADLMQLVAERNLFGCSTFVVTPARSATGGMLVGRNLDYPDSQSLRPHWRPIVFARDGKLKILSIHVPGQSGILTGINEKGVFLAIKVSHGASTSHATPAGFIFRKVLENARTAKHAVELYTAEKRTVALNVTIVDAKEAFELEIDAQSHAVREPNAAGLLYGANHYESASMGGGAEGRDYRWDVLSRHDEGDAKLSFEDVKKLTGDAGGYLEDASTNVLAVLVDYKANALYFGSDPEGNGKSAEGKLERIDLSRVFGARRDE